MRWPRRRSYMQSHGDQRQQGRDPVAETQGAGAGAADKWPKHLSIPALGREHAADHERLKQRLKLEQQARDDGAHGLPHKDDRDLNAMQRRICEEIFRGIAGVHRFLAEQLARAAQLLAGLRPLAPGRGAGEVPHRSGGDALAERAPRRADRPEGARARRPPGPPLLPRQQPVAAGGGLSRLAARPGLAAGAADAGGVRLQRPVAPQDLRRGLDRRHLHRALDQRGEPGAGHRRGRVRLAADGSCAVADEAARRGCRGGLPGRRP